MARRITQLEREKLEWLLRTRQNIRIISKYMRRDHSVIVREIKRNSGGRHNYNAKRAQRFTEERKRQKRCCKLEKNLILREYVETKIKEDLSPEQISGLLKHEPPSKLVGTNISHETIYNWIYERSEKYKKLYKHLRTFRPKRHSHGKRKSTRITIKNRTSIHERPELIAKKARFGDWETDSMIFSKGKHCLSVQYERKSMLVRITLIENKSAKETNRAILQSIDSLPQYLFKSITFDNGTEGAYHYKLKHDYPGLETYFCDPYSSWQKGGVENINKLIRQYLPRKTNLASLTQEDITNIQNRLNNRPRKGLKYKSPNQVIQSLVHY